MEINKLVWNLKRKNEKLENQNKNLIIRNKELQNKVLELMKEIPCKNINKEH